MNKYKILYKYLQRISLAGIFIIVISHIFLKQYMNKPMYNFTILLLITNYISYH